MLFQIQVDRERAIRQERIIACFFDILTIVELKQVCHARSGLMNVRYEDICVESQQTIPENEKAVNYPGAKSRRGKWLLNSKNRLKFRLGFVIYIKKFIF